MLRTAIILSFLTLSLASCMQTNKKVFEEFTDISIPATAQVDRDEYHDMGQDYEKLLELRLTPTAIAELEQSIKKSAFFVSTAYVDSNNVPADLMRKVDERKGIWYRNNSGWGFYGSTLNERDNVTATIDTVQKMVKFQYLAD